MKKTDLENNTPLTAAEKKQIKNLVKEGKKIAAIQKEQFPHRAYAEIKAVAQEETTGSSLGIKIRITNKLNAMLKAKTKAERSVINKEIRKLVNDLYKQQKAMADKLSKIRLVLK